ncbi:MAG: PAS domain S-box protein [Methanoregula sp.]
MVLERTGTFRVDAVGSASAAKKRLSEEKYAAIVCDYQMPGTNGIGFLKYVRKTYGTIPFILFTGKGREQVAIDAINSGADFYLQKFGDPDIMYAELIHVLMREIVRRETEEALHQSEEKFSRVFLLNPAISTITRLKTGEFIDVNEAFLTATGYTRDEVIGHTFHEMRIFSDPGSKVEIITRIQQENQIKNIETTIRTRSGDMRDILFSGKVMRIGTSECVYTECIDITERKRAEEQLLGTQQRLTDIINFLPDATFVIDTSGHVIAWNKAIEEMTGVLARDILGKGDYEYAVPFYGTRRPILIDLVFSSKEEIQKNYSNININENILTAETTHAIPRGKPVTLWGKAAPLYDKEGKIIGGIESIRDITDRKQAEETLRESHQMQKDIINTIPSRVFWKDRNLRYLGCNTAFARDAGFTEPEDIMGKDDSQLCWQEHASRYQNDDRDVIEKGISKFFIEEPQTTPEGTQIILLTSKVPMRNSNGEITGIVGSYFDITERKKTEEKLRKSEELLRRAEKSAQFGNWEYRLGSGKVEPSEGAKELFEVWDPVWNISEVQKILLPKYWQITDDALHGLIHHNRPYDREFEIRRHSDGMIRWIHSKAEYDPEKKVVFGIIHDITDRKRAQDAQKQAVRKLDLLSSITRHDIMNKVTVILGNVTALNKRTHETNISRHVARIEAAAKAIRTQLEFSKIYQQLGTREPMWQNVSTLLHELLIPEEIRFTEEVKGIWIFSDPMLEMVFNNLLDNSIRHGQHVTAIHVREEQTPEGLHLIWEDNGVGIPPDEKEQIFEGEYGRESAHGLFLVREILALTNISIRETGTEGEGARFLCVVPNGSFRTGSS